jgi:hypothetical protein
MIKIDMKTKKTNVLRQPTPNLVQVVDPTRILVRWWWLLSLG